MRVAAPGEIPLCWGSERACCWCSWPTTCCIQVSLKPLAYARSFFG